MARNVPTSLYDLGMRSLSLAMFDRLIQEKTIISASKLFYEFVTSRLLPRPVLSDLAQNFIIEIARFILNDKVKYTPTEYLTKVRATAQRSRSYSSFKHHKNRRERLTWLRDLFKNCIRVLTITCTEMEFAPSCILKELNKFPINVHLESLLVDSAIEGFLISNNIWQQQTSFTRSTDEDRNLPEGSWKCVVFPDRIFKVDQNNVDVCDDVITHVRRQGLHLNLRQDDFEIEFYSHKVISVLFHTFKSFEAKHGNRPSLVHSATSTSIKLDGFIFQRPIEEDFNMFRTVLRESSSHGFTVDLASIDFDDVSTDMIATILHLLPNPTDLRQLCISHPNPISIIKYKDLLLQFSNLEEFSLSTTVGEIEEITFSETCELWNDVILQWPDLQSLILSGVQMSFQQTNTDSCSANNLVRFPKLLLSLKLVHGSVSKDCLDWLSTCCQEICQSNSATSFFPQLTLYTETCLSNDLNLWESLFCLLEKMWVNYTRLFRFPPLKLKLLRDSFVFHHCCLAGNCTRSPDFFESLKPRPFTACAKRPFFLLKF
ncbi:unnamed protein product [Clavelina lepadiformis]|uniref:Uncharacterized protein n=1 Tax=Clavelina lepadiformis TaxID=159417 RepID=A0ABP0G141_CLALP